VPKTRFCLQPKPMEKDPSKYLSNEPRESWQGWNQAR